MGRAPMSRPRLLLLDELSLGLAPAIVQLGGIITDLNRDGTTVLLVEQNTRIAQGGTGEELLNDPAVHETYLGGVAG